MQHTRTVHVVHGKADLYDKDGGGAGGGEGGQPNAGRGQGKCFSVMSVQGVMRIFFVPAQHTGGKTKCATR